MSDPSGATDTSSMTEQATEQDNASNTPGWARFLTKLLDDLIKIPGTNQGIGIDALVGLIPGVGDSATGLGSMALLVLALRQKVPTVVIVKMLGNIGIDVVTGFVPVLGDIFDVAWRSNRRNLELIERYGNAKQSPAVADYVLVVGGFLLAGLAIAMPFLVSAAIGYEIARQLQ